MASKIRITIDGIPADTFADKQIPLKFDFQIESVNDFGARKGSGSSSKYGLPGTPTNEKIFKIFGRITSLNGSLNTDSIKEYQNAAIEIDNVPFAQGKVKLLKVTQNSNRSSRKGIDYEVIFLTGNADWFVDLKGKTLQDIDWSDLDHNFNTINITAGWNANSAVIDYGYTLIKWKDWLNQGAGFLVDEDNTPFIFATAIFERAFSLIGYTITHNDLTLIDLKQIMHPVPLRNYGPDFFLAKTDCVCTVSAAQVGSSALAMAIRFATEITDNGGNHAIAPAIYVNSNATTSQYTAPYDGLYRFRYTATLTAIGGPPKLFLMQAQVNGGLIAADRFPAVPLPFSCVNGDVMSFDYTHQLVAGDIVEFPVAMFFGGAAAFTVSAGDLEVNMLGYDWISGTSIVFFDFLVPDWNLLEYIKGITEIPNLYINADSGAKTVEIRKRNTFFTGDSDWQPKLDYSKTGIKTIIEESLNIEQVYKEDSNDATVDQLNETKGLKMYATLYELTDPTATGKRNIINSFFAPTIHIKDSSIAGFAGDDTAPQIPLIWPENYFETPTEIFTDFLFAPRVLWHFGQVLTPGGGEPSPEGSVSYTVSGATLRVGWPKSFMVDYDDQTGTRINLSYADQSTGFTNVTEGLTKKYYLNQLASVNHGIQVQEWVLLKLTDILDVDFRTYKILNGARHVLQKIDGYNPLKQDSTKCIFIEAVNATEDDDTRTESSEIKGLIVDV